MSELACLKLSALLWAIHLLFQSISARSEFGDDYLVSSRDQGQAATGVMYGRATRALANYMENYAPFIALDAGLIMTGLGGGWGATVWIVARAIYLPCYLLGLKYVRSIDWGVSIVGLAMMGWRLAGF